MDPGPGKSAKARDDHPVGRVAPTGSPVFTDGPGRAFAVGVQT